jgi:AhpD family alkylhydroperoxidase
MEKPSTLTYAQFQERAPAIHQALRALTEAATRGSDVPPELVELAKIRASHVNRCHFCVAYHRKLAQGIGVSAERLDGLAFPLGDERVARLYSERERFALRWADALTMLSGPALDDDLRREAAAHFSQAQLVALTASIASVNAWNRLGVAFDFPPGGTSTT